ncbi:MAG: PorP/SprF family type IX secretion system membrane protein [Tunicatimonas sp.]
MIINATLVLLRIKPQTVLVVLLLMVAQQAAAQSAMFSQYYFSPLNVNPALLGSQSNGMAGVQHRTQWRNLANPHQASALSLAKPIFVPGGRRPAGGIGLSVVNETVGTDRFYRATGVNLGAAYNLSLDHRQTQQLSFGLQGGFTQRRLYLDRLQWGSQYDPAVGFNPEISPSIETLNDRVGFTSFTAGLTYHYNPSRELLLRRLSGFTGLAVANLNRPYSSFRQTERSREALLLRWHSGLEFPVSPSVRLLPQMLVAYRDAQQYHVNVGTYVHYAFSPPYQATEEHLQLLAGAWYRWNDSWVTSAGLSYQNYLLAVSYDFNTQPVAAGAFRGGAFEVSLAYRWFNKRTTLRNFSTPMI